MVCTDEGILNRFFGLLLTPEHTHGKGQSAGLMTVHKQPIGAHIAPLDFLDKVKIAFHFCAQGSLFA